MDDFPDMIAGLEKLRDQLKETIARLEQELEERLNDRPTREEP